MKPFRVNRVQSFCKRNFPNSLFAPQCANLLHNLPLVQNLQFLCNCHNRHSLCLLYPRTFTICTLKDPNRMFYYHKTSSFPYLLHDHATDSFQGQLSLSMSLSASHLSSCCSGYSLVKVTQPNNCSENEITDLCDFESAHDLVASAQINV